ncbi:MAG: amino-acid N-acetyltransferase [Gammaproteobacteria bacterium]|nr:amino-acid N-acetyltransferase [Gammaproteobacteria bacterium]
MQQTDQDYVNWFRHSAPYINAHRGRTFVVYVCGEAVDHENFKHLVHDLNLLSSLGVKLVLVHGSRPQIAAARQEAGLAATSEQGKTITTAEQMPLITAVVGQQSAKLEALFSMGLANSPMQGSRIRTVRGNYIIARPIGINNGIDYAYTGAVRRVDAKAIRAQLELDNLVLISCLGYSPTGEGFNLSAEQVAGQVATSLQADKLIVLGADSGITNSRGERVTELLTKAANRLVQQHQSQAQQWSDLSVYLDVLSQACEAGVKRGHLLSYQINGALLTELFSRDGSGTMLAKESYEKIRTATIDDAGGILELIRPMEQDGLLVRRSRELLEAEIHYFSVIEMDGAIIGCAALYPFAEERQAELACVAINPAYRGADRGLVLLHHIEQQAQRLGLDQIFVLTTAAAHWFVENGFTPSSLSALPAARQQLYNYQRNSKVFSKALR